MKKSDETPDFSKPVDIKAFLYNEFGACGCSELSAMIEVVCGLLEWIEKDKDNTCYYDSLYGGNIGVYYLLVGLLDSSGMCEHGISIRFPFLTKSGKEFMNALQTISEVDIKNSSGTAYDGLYYGD